MNKETILECFFKKRDAVKAMKDLCENYPKYLTKISLQPANFEKYETVTSQGRSMFNDQQSSLEKTLSLCSAFWLNAFSDISLLKTEEASLITMSLS